MQNGLLAALVGLLLALSGCAASDIPIEETRASMPEAFGTTYKLGVGDKVRVIVFNEQTLSGEFQVNDNGKVAMPLVGEIPALGSTTSELAGFIRNGLANGYLRDPKVSAEVLTYRPFFILGEIRTPAQYPYVNGLTVMNAVAVAGGFTPRAAKNTVFIRRAGEDQERRYKLTPDLRALPGDTIRVGERYF